MRRHFLLGGVILVIALLVACAQAPTAAPASGQVGQAAVQSLEVMQSVSSNGDLNVLAKGTLPDGCTQLAEPVISRSGTLIVVILPWTTETKPNCAGGAQTYERVIPLGQNLPAGRYTVSVNGQQQVFDVEPAKTAAIAAANAAVATATQPAAVQQPTPTPTTALPASAVLPASAAQQPTAAPAVVEAAAAAQPTAQPAVQSAAPPSASAEQPGTCDNKAAFYADVSIPDGTLFDPGQTFTKTWRILNAGSCAWSGYTLVYKDGDPLGAPVSVPLAGAVAAGDTVDISVKMTAPQKPGGYYSDWLISARDGATFGLGAGKDGLLWTKIGVRTLIPVTGGQPSCAYQTDPDTESQVLQLINQARLDKGLAPFKLNEKLSAAAREHSQDMACNDFVDHYGSDGSTWYGRIQAQGLRYGTASENIYAGNPQFGGTAQGAFNWWMNSQIHRDNILNPKSTQIGVGYIIDDSSTYKGYYTLDFTSP